MKSPKYRASNLGFRRLKKEAEERLIKFEYAVIWLLVLIAITSIVWSISLHIVSGDFNNGIIGAKLFFQPRDFERMDKRAKNIFYQDLGELINRTYTDAAIDERTIETTVENVIDINKANNHSNDKIEADLDTTDEVTLNETTTPKPKKRRILHLFRISSSVDSENFEEISDDEGNSGNSTISNKTRPDIAADRKFLSTMFADVEPSFLRQSIAVQFVYSFPFLTEIMAIIWTAMCLVYQSSLKKYWGLPKPWRIVIPSIFIFTIMTLGTMIYAIVTNRFLKIFCTHLKSSLTAPDIISCGDAMNVLRPIIRCHQFSHDVYLNLLRISYILSFLLWTMALLIMVLRYVFAIDFQLVDVRVGYETPPIRRRSPEINVVRHKTQSQSSALKMRVDERPRHKSEDDFQSAKSNISEVATPLLEKPTVVTHRK